MGVNYGLDKVRFPAPVPVDSRVRARRRLVSAELKAPNTIQLKQEVSIEIEGDAKPACVAESADAPGLRLRWSDRCRASRAPESRRGGPAALPARGTPARPQSTAPFGREVGKGVADVTPLGAAPLAIFLIVAVVVGTRLLLLARRTRELPELSIGVGLLLIALVGFPIEIIGRVPPHAGTDFGSRLFAIGFLASSTGIYLFFVFTWKVFRPRSRLAASVVAAVGVALLVNWFGLVHAEFQGGTLAEILPRTRPWAIGEVVALMAAFAWSGAESLRYYGTLRRRLALGLVDPVIVNRFLLWGISGCLLPALSLAIVFFLLAGLVVMRDPIPLATIAVIGTAMSVTWLLTFLPPGRYQRFLRERARPEPEPSAAR